MESQFDGLRDSKVKKEKDEIQITVTLECEELLSKQLEKVNQGFDLGRITRKNLAVYILEKGIKNFCEDDVQAVRESVLTDISLLDHLYRQAKESGEVPAALREFLWKSLNLNAPIKKSKKTTQSRYSNAISKKEEAA